MGPPGQPSAAGLAACTNRRPPPSCRPITRLGGRQRAQGKGCADDPRSAPTRAFDPGDRSDHWTRPQDRPQVPQGRARAAGLRPAVAAAEPPGPLQGLYPGPARGDPEADRQPPAAGDPGARLSGWRDHRQSSRREGAKLAYARCGRARRRSSSAASRPGRASRLRSTSPTSECASQISRITRAWSGCLPWCSASRATSSPASWRARVWTSWCAATWRLSPPSAGCPGRSSTTA